MKRFLVKWFVLFAAIFGVALYYFSNIYDETTGDMGRIGCIPFAQEYERVTNSEKYKHGAKHIAINIEEASAYSYLLIGDSFSEPEHALSHGISDVIGDTLRVITDHIGSVYAPTQVLWYGLNNHVFSPGQTVILESIGRSIPIRFASMDYDCVRRPEGLLTVDELMGKMSSATAVPSNVMGFKYNFQLNDLLTWLRIAIGYNQPINKCHLDRPLFTHDKFGSNVFYYFEDKEICDLSDEKLEKIAEGVNRFFAKAEEEGVILYLLMTADKYDLYYPYTTDPPFGKPNLREFIKKIDPRYLDRIISSADTLAPYLVRGEKDIYRINDSHWTVRTGEIIGHIVGKRIMTDRAAKEAAQAEGE